MTDESSATDYAGSSAPIEPKASGGRKFLFGCLAIGGAIVVIAILGILSFVSWLRTPGELMEPGSLLDDGTVFYGEIRLRAEDPGVREFVTEALAAQRAREADSRRELPGPLRGIVERLQGRRSEEPDLDRFLPIVLAVMKQADASGETSPPLFAVSLPRMGNRLRLADMIMAFFGRWTDPESDMRMERHGEEVLYLFPDPHARLWVSMVGSDILLSRDESAVRAGIDRLTGAVAPPGGPTLLAERPEGTILYMNTRAGHVDEVIQMIGGAIPAFGDALGRVAGDAQALTLFATLVSSDVLEGEIRIRGGEAATGDTDHQGSVTAPLPEGEMTLSVTPAPAPPGGGRAWVVRVTGIASAAKSGVLALDRAEGVTINVE